MKYCPETATKILKLIEVGNFSKHASEANNVSESSFHKWRLKYPTFRASIRVAEAKRITTLTKELDKNKSFPALIWKLERLDREHFHLPTASEKEMESRIDDLESRVKINKETKN